MVIHRTSGKGRIFFIEQAGGKQVDGVRRVCILVAAKAYVFAAVSD